MRISIAYEGECILLSCSIKIIRSPPQWELFMRLSIGLAMAALPLMFMKGFAQERADAAQLQAAESWLQAKALDAAHMRSMSVEDRAKAVLFATYKFCKVGDQRHTDLNNLYEDCVAQCGGFAYFFRGIAEFIGLETRYSKLFNIPNQGNHVGVEVKMPSGRWGFFDPTFGNFFTQDGEYAGEALSIHSVSTEFNATGLDDAVLQADKNLPLQTATEPSRAFGATFDHRLMSLRNYQVAEAITQDDPDEMLMLEIPVDAISDIEIGAFSSNDPTALNAAWLDYTNKTLNDNNPYNDTSYDSALLYNSETLKTTILSFNRLIPMKFYNLSIKFYNSGVGQRIQIQNVGKSLRFGARTISEAPPGISEFTISFLPAKASGQIYLRNMDRGGIVRMFAMRLSRSAGTRSDKSADGVSFR